MTCLDQTDTSLSKEGLYLCHQIGNVVDIHTENRMLRLAELRLLEKQLAERVRLCAPSHRDNQSETNREGCQRDDQAIIPIKAMLLEEPPRPIFSTCVNLFFSL